MSAEVFETLLLRRSNSSPVASGLSTCCGRDWKLVMFFLIRSAVCIGAVALLATGGGKTDIGRVLDIGGRETAQRLGSRRNGGQGRSRQARGTLRPVGRHADGIGSGAGLDGTGRSTGGRVGAPASGNACAALSLQAPRERTCRILHAVLGSGCGRLGAVRAWRTCLHAPPRCGGTVSQDPTSSERPSTRQQDGRQPVEALSIS